MPLDDFGQAVNLRDLLFVLDKQMSTRLEESQTQLQIDRLPKVIKGHKATISLLFEHLIDNAIKFRQRDIPCLIRINATEEQEHWKFSVADNGIGIPLNFQPKLFQLFQKMHQRKEDKGTGAGLAICKRIIVQHGGRIQVESAPGQGSTFYFSLKKTGKP
ncbi:MAG: ATP-binding protein [Bacteroidota bacterium]